MEATESETRIVSLTVMSDVCRFEFCRYFALVNSRVVNRQGSKGDVYFGGALPGQGCTGCSHFPRPASPPPRTPMHSAIPLFLWMQSHARHPTRAERTTSFWRAKAHAGGSGFISSKYTPLRMKFKRPSHRFQHERIKREQQLNPKCIRDPKISRSVYPPELRFAFSMFLVVASAVLGAVYNVSIGLEQRNLVAAEGLVVVIHGLVEAQILFWCCHYCSWHATAKALSTHRGCCSSGIPDIGRRI
jgi:hypothetical protein